MIGFDSDHPNASVLGHRYDGFYHDGERSIILLDDGVPKAVLGYSLDPTVVVQIQGVLGMRPPKRWSHMLLERLAEEHGSFVVQSAFNNLYALDFHAFLRNSGVYHDALGAEPSFRDAIGFSAVDRERIMTCFERIPDDHRPVSRLHPSTAFVRYDVSAYSFARASGRSCARERRGFYPDIRVE